MKKNKNKILQAKIQALNNQLNQKEVKKENRESKESVLNINKAIKKDILQTVILIIVSFGILFLVKYLDSNFLLNKFF